MSRLAARVARAIEAREQLDRLSAPVNSKVRGALRRGRTRDLLSGTPTGHPAHPAVILLPLGSWLSSLVADASGERRMARRLVGVGLWAAIPAVATGLADWADTDGVEQRVGAVHMATNAAAAGLLAASYGFRVRGRYAKGLLTSLAGVSLAGLSGWLGGHLAYSLGVGVDTNSFEGGPTDWTPLEETPSESDGEGLVTGHASGVGVVVTRAGGDRERVMANRCSHRGGPLSEGELTGNCVRCPWHGSEFDLTDGLVMRGPATEPQPVYEVRSGEGITEVRRMEGRALRLNTVRPRRP